MKKPKAAPDLLCEFVAAVDAWVEWSILFKSPASAISEAAAGRVPANYQDCMARGWECQQKRDEARGHILALAPLLVKTLVADQRDGTEDAPRQVLTIAQAAESINGDGADAIEESWPQTKVSLRLAEAAARQLTTVSRIGQADNKADRKINSSIPETAGFSELYNRVAKAKEKGESINIAQSCREISAPHGGNPESLEREWRRFKNPGK